MKALANTLARLVERSPVKPVSRDDRRSWFFLATIQIGVTICVPLFALGGQLGRHARFVDLAPAVVSGAAVVVTFAIMTALVGMRARVPTAMLMRRAFGEQGGQWVAALLIVTLFGWFGVQTEMLVHSIQALLEASVAWRVPSLPLTIACGAMMSSTAIVGFRALGKIAYVAVPLLLAVIAVPTWIALTTHDMKPLLLAPAAESVYGFGIIVSIIAGGHMVAVTTTPDLARFMRSRRDTVIGMVVSLGIALPALLLVSAMLSLVYGSPDLVSVLVSAGVGGPALLVIILATWTSNDKNLYEAALSLSTLLPRWERWQLTALAGVVGTLMAVAGIFEHFIQVLLVLGIAVAPLAGVYLADSLAAAPPQRAVRWRSFAAWGGGSLIGYLTLPANAHGFGALHLTSVPTLDALLAAGALHGLFAKMPQFGTRRHPA